MLHQRKNPAVHGVEDITSTYTPRFECSDWNRCIGAEREWGIIKKRSESDSRGGLQRWDVANSTSGSRLILYLVFIIFF